MKVVIVGGVAGGATAAARIRRLDEQAQIVMFERTGYVSYANCGLPYYVGGTIEDQSALTLQTPQRFWERFRVDVRVHHEVTEIDVNQRVVQVRNLETGETFAEPYDELLLSPGAKPVMPPLPGIDADRVFTLRTVEDALAMRAFVEGQKPESAVLVGAGFIGLEMAENLVDAGVQVTLVQRPHQVMAPFDADMASFLHAELRAHGVGLELGANVEGFSPEEGGVAVHLEGKNSLHASMVVMAVGVAPDTALAKQAGLELGVKGSILVDDRMQTSAPHVHAVGDAVQVRNFVTGQDALVSLAGPANKQARIAADNICGGDSAFSGALGSSVLKVFDQTAACTGINERTARAAGIAYDKVVLSPASHAGYYPGGKVMTMKVLFEPGAGKLLGAQIIGPDGVDKRIDVLATAIHAGLSVLDLAELDLAYAPPYSSAKDPVNMAGFMAENVACGVMKQFHYEDVAGLPRDGSVVLLDARTPGEYARGHVDGFVNIPLDSLRDRLSEVPAGKPVYVMCQSGLRSYLACRILMQNGFDAYNFSGGYRFYHAVHNDALMRSQGAAVDPVATQAHPCGAEKA